MRIFYTGVSWWFFYMSLIDCKPPQVSRSSFCILVYSNNAVDSMVSTRPLLSKSSIPFIKPLGIVSRAPITTDITVIFMFHSFFVFLVPQHGLGTHLSFRFLLILHCGPPGRQSPQFNRFSFSFLFLLTITESGLFAEIRWSIFISRSQRILCVSISRTYSGLCIYHLFILLFSLLLLLLLKLWKR